jgi:hypothetical protein
MENEWSKGSIRYKKNMWPQNEMRCSETEGGKMAARACIMGNIAPSENLLPLLPPPT